MTRPKRILHLHSSFDLGGKEARAVRLMNAFGGAAEHVVLSAVPHALGARKAIAPDIAVAFPGQAAPALHGKPSLPRYWRIARYMRGFDLVLSYNWGSMDGVMAHRIFARLSSLPPLIHHEDGFNEDERDRRDWRRDAFRRIALPTARHVMVPSRTLDAIARQAWKCSNRQVIKFDNGIDPGAYIATASPPPVAKRPDEIWIGTIAGLRPVKNLTALVRAVAAAGDDRLRLVIAGEGPDREAIEAEAARLGIAHKVTLLGFCDRPWDVVTHFDIFALSSWSEQQPISLMEAMAAGLPAACYAVGDVRDMVAPENGDFIVAPGDEARLTEAIRALASDATLRRHIGAANRAVATERFDEAGMIGRFADIYGEAMEDERFSGTIAGRSASGGS